MSDLARFLRHLRYVDDDLVDLRGRIVVESFRARQLYERIL